MSSGEGNGTPLQYSCLGSLRVGHNWATSFHFSLLCIGEGNGNPLQCSCLENPRDGKAWWAAVYGVAQSRTRLKWFGSSSSDEFKIKELGNGGAGTWIQAFWLECTGVCWLYLEKDFTWLFPYNFCSYWHCIWRPKKYKLISYPESWGALPVLERLNHVTWLG